MRALLLTFLLLTASASAWSEPHSYVPPNGFVPDAETAITIAVAIWTPIYGETNLKRQRPFQARLHDGVWFVSGSLPWLHVGGVAEAEISKKDGRVLHVSHGK